MFEKFAHLEIRFKRSVVCFWVFYWHDSIIIHLMYLPGMLFKQRNKLILIGIIQEFYTNLSLYTFLYIRITKINVNMSPKSTGSF